MNPPDVAAIYQEESYPAMSHPPAHPSVIAATALLGGLRMPPLARLRILEIGCSTGHHILPIAAAYPDAQITAIDFSPAAIAEAQRLAAIASITNVNFICADLLQWQAPEQAFDCIIAQTAAEAGGRARESDVGEDLNQGDLSREDIDGRQE